MDNLIVGLIGLLALVYVGSKIYKQMTGTGGCGCGGGGSTKVLVKKIQHQVDAAVVAVVAVATILH